jgi:predicted DNA-binding mobile mystery protein A
MQKELRVRVQRKMDLETRRLQLARAERQPLDGWLRRARKALGVNATEIARRLEVDPSMVFYLERSECKETISLKRLGQMAEAMDCKLVYGIVPREGTFEDLALEQLEHRILYGRRRDGSR